MALNDPDWMNDDGRFDSTFTVITCGVIAPHLLAAGAAWVAWKGGITLSSKGAVVHYSGFHAVASVTDFCLGVALILVSKFLLPNVYRRNYNYQYFAIAGIVMVGIGILWFVVAAMLH